MKTGLLLLLITLSQFSTCGSSEKQDFGNSNQLPKGFLFIDVSKLQNEDEKIEVKVPDGQTEILFSNGNIKFIKESESFDIINDEHKYRDKINVESFYPEYGLFVVACKEVLPDGYLVNFNNSERVIKRSALTNFVNLNDYWSHVYITATETNPIRDSPDVEGNVIKNLDEYVFTVLSVEGDWLKVIDSKDCYIGESPSQTNIEGWIRWKKDGVIIIDVGYVC